MYSVYLADLVGDVEGHFYFMQTLGKIKGASYIDTCERKILIKKYPIKGMMERFRIYRKVFAEAKKQKGKKIVHFQTGDKFYFLPILFSPETAECKVVITLHRCPVHPFMIALLKNFARKISKIVVLSDSLAKQLRAIGIHNVEVIEHPSFYDYSAIGTKEELREKYGISTDKIILSALGGTRYDKGVDLLLDSLSLLTEDERRRIVCNIAGRPQDFDASYITNSINRCRGVEVRVDLRNLSDTEFIENIKLTDWLVVPYRKSFTGVSGPMVEAISQGIPCIVPEDSSLSLFCAKYGAAKTFRGEDAHSLAATIREIISRKESLILSGIERLNRDYFVSKHIELYNTLYT